ncbi:hypothetical protein CEUSTIGMA_g10472.t1 [Chlamydomonas eustigma]|uniref:Ribosomal RNA-processing protein 8 n=1 Tax=Chlamydomonas eustigma TaxID=1157962 RepID=A0A250XJ50_9CHLO|nr:hypothetical protein CEUSTIGMA_g10472.t1 [Chlamydomonas eustigma]|eukprot:GAX83046.1 hypothetical protein CEUSTIGMA_g10472.t1 [Chlamydomonas eustigma]
MDELDDAFTSDWDLTNLFPTVSTKRTNHSISTKRWNELIDKPVRLPATKKLKIKGMCVEKNSLGSQQPKNSESVSQAEGQQSRGSSAGRTTQPTQGLIKGIKKATDESVIEKGPAKAQMVKAALGSSRVQKTKFTEEGNNPISAPPRSLQAPESGGKSKKSVPSLQQHVRVQESMHQFSTSASTKHKTEMKSQHSRQVRDIKSSRDSTSEDSSALKRPRGDSDTTTAGRMAPVMALKEGNRVPPEPKPVAMNQDINAQQPKFTSFEGNNVLLHQEHAMKRSAAPASSLLDKMAARLQGGRFRSLNEALYTRSGSDALDMMQTDPGLFKHYHDGFQQQTKGWPLQPVEVAANWLTTLPQETVVADFGCGDARLMRTVKQVNLIRV